MRPVLALSFWHLGCNYSFLVYLHYLSLQDEMFHINIIYVLLICVASEFCFLHQRIFSVLIFWSILLLFLIVLLWFMSLLSNWIYVEMTTERQGTPLVFPDGHLASHHWAMFLLPHNLNIILIIWIFRNLFCPWFLGLQNENNDLELS